MTRRTSVAWAAVVLAQIVPALVADADDAAISVQNAGFERLEPGGRVVGWQVEVAEGESAGVVRGTAEVAREGAGSLEVIHAAPAATVVVSEPVRLTVGHLYRLSGWIRTDGQT